MTVRELFDFITDITITADNIEQYLDTAMEIASTRSFQGMTEEDKVDEEVACVVTVVMMMIVVVIPVMKKKENRGQCLDPKMSLQRREGDAFCMANFIVEL
nr:hypothetical protein BaRGS_032319 [Batillaria attramentaria]